ncbi:MAG TPA: BTAD domain-containing putative transcriptional regulator [Gemmatimonadales bacterium]|nr:BTAD domain-containing putative transcriptional regulator [Gemmatimonadales bacterium]
MHYLQTLGGLSLSSDAPEAHGPPLANRRSLLILALLAAAPEHRHRRDYLARLLWPQSERPRALRALRQALFHLARCAGDVIHKDDDAVSLIPERLSVDLWDFDHAVKAGAYGRAVAVYRGRFLQGLEQKAGVELEHWIEAENARLEAGVELAFSREIERLSGTGAHAEAVRLAQALVEQNPLDDDRQKVLLRALLAAGDDLEALSAYQAYRTLIARETGDEPPAELQRTVARLRTEVLQSGVAPPPAVGATEPPPTVPWHGRRRRAQVAVAALAVLTMLGWLALSRRIRTEAPLSQATYRLLATLQHGNGAAVAEVTVRAGAADVRINPHLTTTDLPSPDGRRVASVEHSNTGQNLVVRDGEEIRTLTRAPHDEYPVAWSPDGRRLIYASRRLLQDGRGYAYRLAVVDLETGVSRVFATEESSQALRAAWSPDGTRIAYVAAQDRATDVFVADADLTNPRNVSRHPAADHSPSWSTDGDHLAFVSERAGGPDVYTVRPDGSDLRPVTHTKAAAHRVVWVSPTLLAYLRRRSDHADVWLADAFTGEQQAVTATGTFTDILAVQSDARRWIDHISLGPFPRVVSPGQYLRLSAAAVTSGGDTLAAGGLPLRWRVMPAAVAQVGEGGEFRILRPGAFRVVASAGGWRTDTAVLTSVNVTAVRVNPQLVEDWTQGLVPQRWRTFGRALPSTEVAGGLDGRGMLINHGDEFLDGGAVTRESLAMDRGLTVEVLGRMRFTGRLHQVWGMALYPQAPADSALAAGTAAPLVEFRVQGPVGEDSGRAWITMPQGRYALPVPPHARFWRRYALQVLPDGTVDLLIDGTMLWRSTERLPRSRLTSAYLGLGFRSYQSSMLHGTVTVYAAPRYRLPVMPPP